MKLRLLASKALLKVKKYSPEMLVGVGVVGMVGTVVTACVATTKIDTIHEEIAKKKAEVDEAMQIQIDSIKVGKEEIFYTEADAKKDMVIINTKGALKYVKLYAPSIILGAASIGCILAGFGIMKKRYLGVVAAYASLDETFKKYRGKVAERYGEAAEKETMEAVIAEAKANGYEENPKAHGKYSQYARFFDETAACWTEDPEYNMAYLHAVQAQVNDLLNIQGHVFLNEVYDRLGMARTTAGSVVGWVKGNGDSFIDFGIFDGNTRVTRAFVNGWEASILLDFNVDGVIHELI